MPNRLIHRLAGAVLAAILAPAAHAQLFWRAPHFETGVATGEEPGHLTAMPGATGPEREAGMAWATRAALNVAALQCQFSPALMTARNYNDLIAHHRGELAAHYAVLQAYFRRTAPKGATTRSVAEAFDRYNTRTYSSFSTVSAQLGFCQTAAHVGEQALLAPKGRFSALARERLRELRSSLVPVGDMIYAAPAPLQLASLSPIPGACTVSRRRGHC